MRRLTDVIITTADRPAPPRGRIARQAPAAKAAPARAARPRRRRVAPLWWPLARTGLVVALAILVFAGGPIWLVRSGRLANFQHRASDRLLELSQRSGLRVDRILVEGRRRVPAQDLLAALQIAQGGPILGLDLAAAQARLAALPGVKTATVERRLPDELRVLIAEREPSAIWQNDGHYHLVDREGMAVGDNIDDFPGLPLVAGAGAPEHVAALLDLLAAESGLVGRVKASQWVSGQRWNIEMTGPAGDIEVRLPEDDPAGAWHELARLEAGQKLLERKIAVVDMRLPDRLVLRIPGGIGQPGKTAPTPPTRRKAPGRDA